MPPPGASISGAAAKAKFRASAHSATRGFTKLSAIASSEVTTNKQRGQLPVSQMVALLQMRRDRDQPHPDQRDQQHMAGVEPDRRREMREAADHDGGERHAGDEQEVEQPPIDLFAVDVFCARTHLDIGKPAQSEHAETQDAGQEFRPSANRPCSNSVPSAG